MKTLNEISAFLLTRRKDLELEQSDMYMRIGMKQQQYQRAETGHDMRLSSLLRILEGLDRIGSTTKKSIRNICTQPGKFKGQ